MSQIAQATVAVIGIDIGKNSFHVVGHDDRGAIVLRQKWLRSQVETRLANVPPCLIGMEACVAAHYLSRKLLLERGIAVRQGQRFLRAQLPHILAMPSDVLSPRMVRMIEDLTGDWRRLDERIASLSNEIEAIARQDTGPKMSHSHKRCGASSALAAKWGVPAKIIFT